MFFSTVDKWQAMSTVLTLNAGNALSMEYKAGIICWDKAGKLEEFSSKELGKIISEGDQGTATTFKVIDEKGDTAWLILSDDNFEDLISTAYTVSNAISDLISSDFIIGLILKFSTLDIDFLSEKTATDKYLVFNENPLGFYPLVYAGSERQHFDELQIADFLKTSGLFMNKNRNNWYSVEKIPF